MHFSGVNQFILINENKIVTSGSHLPETIKATASSITSFCNDFVF